jgi:(2Fe-2S) ferredoxin
VCASRGAADVAAAGSAALNEDPAASTRVRVLRGGCYGLCDLGPNVVVRRRRPRDPLALFDADRLSLQGGPDEHVCVAVAVDEAGPLLRAVVEHGAPPTSMLRATREPRLQPRSPVEERIRALRAARGVKGAGPGGEAADDDGEKVR